MHAHKFINQLDEAKLVAAIAEAEQKTSGTIHVYVSHRAHIKARAYAQRRFHQLGLANTSQHNAVLLYLTPRTRQFAIIGDRGVHEKCGDAFWQEVSAQLSAALKLGDYTAAILQTVRQIGDLLAAHFPAAAGDTNAFPTALSH